MTRLEDVGRCCRGAREHDPVERLGVATVVMHDRKFAARASFEVQLADSRVEPHLAALGRLCEDMTVE